MFLIIVDSFMGVRFVDSSRGIKSNYLWFDSYDEGYLRGSPAAGNRFTKLASK